MNLKGMRRSENIEDRRRPERPNNEALVLEALLQVYGDHDAHASEAISQGLTPAKGDYSQLDLGTILGSGGAQDIGLTEGSLMESMGYERPQEQQRMPMVPPPLLMPWLLARGAGRAVKWMGDQ
jgi:hypothetical protein